MASFKLTQTAKSLVLATTVVMFSPAVLAETVSAQAVGVKYANESNEETDLEINVRTEKKSYAVGEPLTFKLTSNKAAYFYLFNLLPDEDDAVQLIPSKFFKANKIKAGQTIVFPSYDLESKEKTPVLAAEKVGKERFMLVASTTKLSFDEIMNITEESGYGYTKITKLKDSFKSQSVSWVELDKPESVINSEDVSTAYFDTRITAKVKSADSPKTKAKDDTLHKVGQLADGNVILLSTNKNKYKVNEEVKIFYASTKAGYINIFAEEENGEEKQVVQKLVKANQLYNVIVDAESPKGKTIFKAYYSILPINSKLSSQDENAVAVHAIAVSK